MDHKALKMQKDNNTHLKHKQITTYTSLGPLDWQTILFAFPTQPRAPGTGPRKTDDFQARLPLVGGCKLNENVPDGRHP